MLEKLFPIDLPPGLYNKGTVYQSKGRWYAGNLVRFFQGKKQPVGGWVQRTLSGDTITGTPNAAVSWRLNDGTTFLAIGTTTGLFVVSSTNVVSNIIPTSITSFFSPPYTWQLTPFGGYLAAVNTVATYGGVSNLWIWQGDPSSPAIAASDPATGIGNNPFSSYGVVATPERFLVLLRGSDPASYTLRNPSRVN